MGDIAHGCRAWKNKQFDTRLHTSPKDWTWMNVKGWMSRVGAGRVTWLNHHHPQDRLWKLCHCGLKERKKKKRCVLSDWVRPGHVSSSSQARSTKTNHHSHSQPSSQSESESSHKWSVSGTFWVWEFGVFFPGRRARLWFFRWLNSCKKNKRMSSRAARPRIEMEM